MISVEKLKPWVERFEAVQTELATSPASETYVRLSRELSELGPVVEVIRAIEAADSEREGLSEIIDDPASESEMRALAEEELRAIGPKLAALELELKRLLLPRDAADERNVILEVRAGTGGDEAALFAADLFRMYQRYADQRKWKVTILSASESGVGGYKEVIASVTGKGAYSRMKYESGVHRVQRVPETETQGRLHTSAITVAVLPEVDEVDIQVDPKELRIDTYCSSGPGGQSVNTTYSAVRITHVPTGEVVTCQDEKSQIKNKAKAMKVLRSRLYEKALEEQQSEIAEKRRAMVGSGDRSEKIRTYNYPQNRVTDHRLGLSLHQLSLIMEGNLDTIVDALITSERTELLESQKIA